MSSSSIVQIAIIINLIYLQSNIELVHIRVDKSIAVSIFDAT